MIRLERAKDWPPPPPAEPVKWETPVEDWPKPPAAPPPEETPEAPPSKKPKD
jgi:hypothetical protein